MNIDLPPNFNIRYPSRELVYCPYCKKYQHFSFNRPRCYMWCSGCGTKFTFTHVGLDSCKSKPYEQSSMEYSNKVPEKYGPPKYLMVYNNWREHPEFTTATLWRLFYWNDYSYATIQKYVLCIKRDLELWKRFNEKV